jgi:hypothetical protein
VILVILVERINATDVIGWSIALEVVLRIRLMASNSGAFPSSHDSGRLASLGVVCLISVVGIVMTAFGCFLGFRSEITAALSDDMTGSITIQDQTSKAGVKNLVVQRADSHH